MSPQRPSVGRIVHYVSHGTPVRADGTQAYTKQCRAAIVTEVADPNFGEGEGETTVGLAVINPGGLFFRSLAEGGCEHDESEAEGNSPSYVGGTWHWPERV